MGLRAWREKKINDKVTQFFRSRYEQIEVRPKKGFFNQKCFFNSVEFALNQKSQCDIYECVTVEGNQAYLHYVVMRNGEYLEVTLGHRAKNIEYYILRRIPRSDWPSIDVEFDRALRNWRLQFTNWIDRVLLRVGRVL